MDREKMVSVAKEMYGSLVGIYDFDSGINDGAEGVWISNKNSGDRFFVDVSKIAIYDYSKNLKIPISEIISIETSDSMYAPIEVKTVNGTFSSAWEVKFDNGYVTFPNTVIFTPNE